MGLKPQQLCEHCCLQLARKLAGTKNEVTNMVLGTEKK